MSEIRIGDKIRIINMIGEPDYAGREGTVELIDGAGQLHGTWGSLAIIPEEDEFEVLSNDLDESIFHKTSKDLMKKIDKYMTKTGKGAVLDSEGKRFVRYDTQDKKLGDLIDEYHKLLDKEEKSKLKEANGIVESQDTEDKTCVICGKTYTGYGNNAEPVADGRCCDDCNIEIVIPARLKQIKNTSNTLNESAVDREQEFQQFKKDVAAGNIGGQFGYDWYEDMVTDAYIEACEEYSNVMIEPSIQAGKGGIFMWIDDEACGEVIDFEEECEELYNRACESDTYAEFKDSVSGYISSLVDKGYENMLEDDYDEDDDYEYSWKEDDTASPLWSVYEEACNQLNVSSDASTQFGIGEVFFRSNVDNTILYLVDFEEECNLMDSLIYELSDPYNITAEEEASIIERIKTFIKDHPYFDSEDDLDESFNTTKTKQLKESKERWNIGSNKLISTDSQEYANLVDLAKLLQERSPNGYEYTVEKTYEDFGANMQWYNIICYDKKGDHWQVLNTRDWLDLANGKDIESVYSTVTSNKYFQDRPKTVDEMSTGELFDSLD